MAYLHSNFDGIDAVILCK